MSDAYADAVVLCPGCGKSWPPETKYCEQCSTSLHNAKTYVPYVEPTTPVQGYAITAPNLVVQSTPAIHDDALNRVRANDYWAQRASAKTMTIIGYIQFAVSGVIALFGIIVLLIVLFIPQLFKGINGMGGGFLRILGDAIVLYGYVVGLVCFVIAYRMALNGFTTFLQRDELLMRIDVAMNTALMATQMTTLTQHMTAQQKNHK